MKARHSRSVLLGVSAIAAFGLVLSGCSGSSGSAEADGDVTLRIIWWGSESRTEATNEVIALFEEQHPNITVDAQGLPSDGYADLLTTQIAAKDEPDVFQIYIELMGEYAERGVLADLDGVDTSKLEPTTTEAAFVDGVQTGVPTGVAAYAIVANNALFEQAGVAIPDDTTWTWDDYVEIAAELSSKLPDGVYGAGPLGLEVPSFAAFIRQQGPDTHLTTEDGELGFEADDVVAYLELVSELHETGGSPGAEVTAEEANTAPEQSGIATGRFAMSTTATSSLPPKAAALGGNITVLRLPGTTPGEAKMTLDPSQYWGVSSRSEHPEEAQMLVDFLVNSQEAGEILKGVRGTPPNSDVRDAVASELSTEEALANDYIASIESEVSSVPLPPAGWATFEANLLRYISEYMFGRMSAEDAAKGLIDETNAAIGR